MPSPTFISIIKRRNQIIKVFQAAYLLLTGITAVGIWSLYSVNQFALFFVDVGYLFGKIAILVYVFTVLPGIFRRLKIQSDPVALIMVFRRQLGIFMYLFVFAHFWFLFGIALVKSGQPPTTIPPYIVFGMLANYFLLALAVTSNDWATKKLGVWWNRIHSLTYVIVWLIFAHVALIRFSVWTVIIGATALAVLFSHLYPRFIKRV